MKTIRKLKMLLATILVVGCTVTVFGADYGTVTINGTTYTMTNTATLIDADIALLDYKAQGLTSTVTASIGGTSYSGYTDVYNAMYDLLVANCTHRFPATGTPNAPHSTGAQYIWPIDSQNDAIWYIPKNQTATFQQNDAGLVGRRLVVVGGGTINRVMDQRRFYLTGNSNLVLCLQGQLTIDGGGAPGAKLAILSVASGKVYIAGSVKIQNSHGQAASDSGGGGAITQRGGTIYMMDNTQIRNCDNITTETPGTEEDPNPLYVSHGGAIAMFGGTFKMMGNAKISDCTTGFNSATGNGIHPSLGGGLYMEGGSFSMNGNATIQGCSASVGGAVYVAGGTFTMNGGLIGSTSMVMDLLDGTQLTYPNVPTTDFNYITEITTDPETRNIAHNGGAIYAKAGTLKFNGGVIAGNETLAVGQVLNGTVWYPADDPNRTATYYGSCVLTQGTARIECRDGMMFYGNRSAGSCIFIGAGSPTTFMPANEFYGGKVYCNLEMRHYGCGIAVTTGAIANLRNNTQVCYNSTYRNGGGLLSLQGAEINLLDDDVLVSHNTAIGVYGATNSGNGGAFRIVGRLNIYKGTISYNYANGYNSYPDDPYDDSGMGGAISSTSDMRGGEQEMSGIAGLRIAEVNLIGGTIEHNKCSRYGGGIYMSSYVTDTATFTLQGTTIKDNESAFDGGGCYLSAREGVLIAKLTNGTIISNTADRDGGGLYFNVLEDATKGIVTIGAETAPNNIVITDNVAVEKGGGVYVTNSTEQPATLTMMSGSVKENEATSHGGGFYVSGGTVSVEGGSISYNEALQDGGGFYVAVPNTTDTTFIKGGAQVSYNRAQNGGGAFVNQGILTIEGAATSIANDTATIAGGGIYLGTGNVTITDASINGNISQNSHGGGFFVANGNFTANNAAITTNHSPNGNGGGVYAGGTNGHVMLNTGTTVTNNNAINGGGICVDGGNLTFTNAVMTGNAASNSGGGFYTTGGDVQINGNSAEISSNTATKWGGGMFIGGNIALDGGTIKQNTAGTRGGGVYVDEGGQFDMTGGIIGGTTANGNYTSGSGSYGGGLYMGGGIAEITGGSISGNHTDNSGYGGGIYMDGGTCTLSGGSMIGGTDESYANTARHGGGIYSAGGIIRVKGGRIAYNEAVDGGGIYSYGESPVVYVEKESSKADVLSYIEHNTADNGGGIYARRGEVHFSDGFIQYNKANHYGGGMYVDTLGMLYLKGNANLYRNYVPASTDGSTNGGGVYLLGQVTVGEKGANGRIMAQENYKGDDGYIYEWTDTGHPETDTIDQVTRNNRNNIYLPHPEDTLVLTSHRDVITVIEDGISLSSRVGFSVPRNYVPVIYCALSDSLVPSSDPVYGGWPSSRKYLNQFSTGHDYQYNVFDDTRHYVAVHYVDKLAVFDPDHVYLYGFWSDVVTGNEYDFECGAIDPDDWNVDTIPIYTPCELAFFISWVNGLNNQSVHESANAKLMADIDMSKYGWVPIGDLTHGYSGTFDGNGHTVTGISGLLYREYLDYGFFGRLDGGTVKDLFVKDAVYALDNVDNLVVGGLVGGIVAASTIENCEASSSITVSNPNTVVGGLIGRMDAGTVHSAIGISDMKGYLMGGLVGELLGGSLYNSFSNCKYTKAENHDKYMGGLVAVNRGTVENCYARLRGSVPKGKFGILVGDNTDGVVNYCYAPAGMTNYKAAGASPTGHGNYGDSFLPYLYGHRDTQVSLAEATNTYVPTGEGVDKQMMVVLNNWVDAKSTASVTYTTWGRPWHESNTVKPLNDDYPILRMPKAEAVGAKAGDPYLYYNPLDSLLVRYTDAASAIWLYRTPADTVRGDNSTSAAKLYIAEDVVLLNNNALKAYVGITLDNSAGAGGANPTYGSFVGIETDETDWHMIATPLSDAHVGIDYQNDNTAYDFSWGHPDGMPYYLFYPKGDDNNGYFPSHRFGEEYPTTSATIEAGSYYNEWDFYSYDEPNYHWINFKRNKASHHYFDIEQHPTMTYTNEELMVPGKGYFAATREETFLQCQGHLNADEVTYDLTQTSGVPRHGYNLIGNPYQAYLDFDAFADANWGDDVDVIWSDSETPSYTILDEDFLEMDTNVETLFGDTAVFYKTFSYGCSSNPDVSAGGFIHPHQGFFVRLGDDKTTATAYFEPDQRNVTAKSKFRGSGHIDYPLVNLFAIEENGAADVVTVELGRPDQGGAALMQSLRVGNGKIWCHYNDKDYAIAYTQPGITEVAIRFESVKDTEYTMRWSTRNGDFSYLHLIDNLTGADVDCLTTDEYRFSASTSDYKSRFRLVFGYTGIEEDAEAETNENFAFIMGDELVVTGEGVLQMFDVTGRMVVNQELHGVQTRVSLPNVANGVYVMRLTEGSQSRIQKMVISK